MQIMTVPHARLLSITKKKKKTFSLLKYKGNIFSFSFIHVEVLKINKNK